MTRSEAETLILRFQGAAEDFAFIGSIPRFSDDPDEQALINAERRRLHTNLSRTRNALIAALTSKE